MVSIIYEKFNNLESNLIRKIAWETIQGNNIIQLKVTKNKVLVDTLKAIKSDSEKNSTMLNMASYPRDINNNL